MTRRGVLAWALVAGLGAGAGGAARGQVVDVERPTTIVVGTPRDGARADRIDAARTGWVRSALPAGALRIEWRVPLGTLIEHPPLVDAHGGIYVVGSRGEVVAVGRDGAERWRVATGATQPGPAALLSDDTLVFVDGAGEAVAVRDGGVGWRVRFGRSGGPAPAPLPLDDGGVVVATRAELAVLDADGHERARTTLPEAASAPLVSALGRVVVVSTTGGVWAWTPGAADVVRVASFGSPIEGGAALSGDHTLLAVAAGGAHLAAVDLRSGTTTTRAVASGGVWLGPPALAPGAAHLELRTPSGDLALTLDDAGEERARALLSVRTPTTPADGGPPTLPVGPHTAPLVDAAGTLAFATDGGAVGVASGTTVDVLAQDVCEPPIGAAARAAVAPVAGLAPLEAGVFVAACHAGALLAVGGDATPAPSAPRRPRGSRGETVPPRL